MRLSKCRLVLPVNCCPPPPPRNKYLKNQLIAGDSLCILKALNSASGGMICHAPSFNILLLMGGLVWAAMVWGAMLFFSSDPEGGFCAGGITDNAAPEMKTWMGAEMAKLGLPMFSTPIEKAASGLADVARLLEKRE